MDRVGSYTRLLGIRGFDGCWCGFCHELFVAVDAYVSVFWVVAFEAGYGVSALCASGHGCYGLSLTSIKYNGPLVIIKHN